MPHSTAKRRYVVETMAGGGIALFDCDNDGKLDIAVVTDSTLEAYLKRGEPMVTLYQQDHIRRRCILLTLPNPRD